MNKKLADRRNTRRKYVIIKGERYVIMDGLPKKIYWRIQKRKTCIDGIANEAVIKGICLACGEEFLHRVDNPGKVCSRKCNGKLNGRKKQ